MVARPPSNKVAALTILRYSPDSASELSLQQHLNIAPDLLANYDRIATDGGDSDESMMAQAVPHQTQQPDRRRVKVYELRDNDWFDRGTGFCSAEFIEVGCPTPQTHPLPSPCIAGCLAPKYNVVFGVAFYTNIAVAIIGLFRPVLFTMTDMLVCPIG